MLTARALEGVVVAREDDVDFVLQQERLEDRAEARGDVVIAGVMLRLGSRRRLQASMVVDSGNPIEIRILFLKGGGKWEHRASAHTG